MSKMMTREEWLNAGKEAEQTKHPPGWSYRRDTRRLVETLEIYELQSKSVEIELR